MSSVQEAINKARFIEAKEHLKVDLAEYEASMKAETVAWILRAYCPNGESVSYEDLRELYLRLRGQK